MMRACKAFLPPRRRGPARLRATWALAAAGLCASVHAQPAIDADAAPVQDTRDERWSIHAQATYVWQRKPAFAAAYSGVNSLSPERERSYSFTGTAFLGLRLGPDTEAYFNPEVVQGVPLSHLTGMGGLTNGELQKTAGASPVVYRARLFMRHTWNLGGGSEDVPADANQLAMRHDRRRATLTLGNFAVTDVFDTSDHAGDARSQFLNWSFLTHGAYDYAADSRGYTWGAALDYRHDDTWSLRAGRFLQPRESNGLQLDHAIFRHYGDQLEVERRHALAGRPGFVKVLAFRNVAVMGRFRDAIAYGQAAGDVPDVAPVRSRHAKVGAGVHVEQQLTDELGGFLRLAMHDGRTESYAFTEIDRAASVGATLSGARWGRAQDALGVALGANGLSGAHRDYLALGGHGFFLGDGRLRYRSEQIAEAYYRFALPTARALQSAVSVGAQYIRNPGYNAERGPVKVVSVRLHAEF